MNEKLKEKIMESLTSVIPITLIVLVLSVVLVPVNIGIVAMFLTGATLLVIGMGFFQLGAEMSMLPLGEGLGATLSKTGKISLTVFITFIMGMIITIAEPDLHVLANQVVSIPNMTLIITIAAGVGIFLVTAILRVLFKVSLSKLLIIFYLIVFSVSAFTPNDYLAMAFDSGGVTTGPITVPFIMAMGIGLASSRGDKNTASDSFGLVALSSVGPILAVMVLGIFYGSSGESYVEPALAVIETTQDLAYEFLHHLPSQAFNVAVAVLPIVGVYLIFQFFTKRFQKREGLRMLVGFAYTYLGLVMFLWGVEVGFVGMGRLLGTGIALSGYKWLLVPLGMVMGFFLVAAEPAVHVLTKQVEEVSEGTIQGSSMNMALSLGVSVSVGLSMLRILTGISIYWLLIPGYVIAIILTFFAPKIFIGIAFDSGGVASGPMASTFLLPFAIGACGALGGNIMMDAFGAVAMVAMTPLIAIQIMGIVSDQKSKKLEAALADSLTLDESEEIIEYPYVGGADND